MSHGGPPNVQNKRARPCVARTRTHASPAFRLDARSAQDQGHASTPVQALQAAPTRPGCKRQRTYGLGRTALRRAMWVVRAGTTGHAAWQGANDGRHRMLDAAPARIASRAAGGLAHGTDQHRLRCRVERRRHRDKSISGTECGLLCIHGHRESFARQLHGVHVVSGSKLRDAVVGEDRLLDDAQVQLDCVRNGARLTDPSLCLARSACIRRAARASDAACQPRRSTYTRGFSFPIIW